MSSKPLVSIITPFLNAEEFFDESILSAMAQTYEPWELLLIDDGSNDGSTTIACRFASAYPERIRYYDHDGHRNLGMSASRNLGLRLAKGDYIAFLDADDVYLPSKLIDQVALLDSNPSAGMVYAATEYWHSWTGKSEDASRDWHWTHFGVPPNTLVAPPKLLTTFLLDGRTVPCMCSLLVRREVIEKVGGSNDAFMGQYEDQVLYAKICLESPVFVSGSCWDKYRQHPKSSCHIARKTGEAGRARFAYLEWLEGYLISSETTDTALWWALRKALRPYRYPRLHRISERAKRLGGKVRDAGLTAAYRTLPISLRRSQRNRGS